MTIDRLGPVDPVSKFRKTNESKKVASSVPADSIDVSEGAKRSAALKKVADIVRAAPDIRLDRVEEVKKKLADPNYVNDAVEAMADKVLDVLDI
ncbi:MAG: flagellar biosynthesis protein FlgM [spirochete symbiont of Stewartia floridana]|nr:MAG: flagellar biosynthesis protein FlgM [spirochete symbiont of Stewartia floridana]